MKIGQRVPDSPGLPEEQEEYRCCHLSPNPGCSNGPYDACVWYFVALYFPHLEFVADGCRVNVVCFPCVWCFSSDEGDCGCGDCGSFVCDCSGCDCAAC